MRLIFGIFFLMSNSAIASEFRQQCRAIDDDYLIFSIQSEFQIKGEFVWRATAYEDQLCRKPYLHFTRYFKISNISAPKIDINSIKSTYTVLSDEVARTLNSIAFCGLRSWKNGVETDVSGLKCEDYQQLNSGQSFYQILKANESSTQLGLTQKDRNGLSEESRPDQWDNEPYVKLR